MTSSQRKVLKPEDQLTREQFQTKLATFTDADAQALGYPDVEVLRLEQKLSRLAGQWRRSKDNIVALEYRETLLSMILRGYNLDMLALEDQLPQHLMPTYPPQKVQLAIQRAYADMLVG